jgi:hypothetical protein
MKPRDARGNPLSVNDVVVTLTDRPQGDVKAVLPGSEIVVAWPGGYWTKTPAKELRRVNQHPIIGTAR